MTTDSQLTLCTAVGLSAAAAALLGPACSDYDVQAGVPTLALSAELIDFGEIVLGNQATIGITIENTGMGNLLIESAELDGTTSTDFAFVELDRDTIGVNDQAELKIRYVPDVVGQDYGRVALTTNDPDQPIVNVDLQGFGVEPEIDLEPSILWFGDVDAGSISALPVTIQARGSGSLKVTDLAFDAGLDTAYSLTLPSGVELPYAMPSGVSMDVIVTFQPPDDAEWNGQLTVKSNAPSAREAHVDLYGNSIDDPTSNAPPMVSISDPDWGEYFVVGDSITLTGVVVDEEDPPTSIVCLAYAAGLPVGTASPDASGNVEIGGISLGEGEQELRLVCLDTDGQSGEDTVEIAVWSTEEPIQYVLSGGPTIYDWWSVDDDIVIRLDGVDIFSDTNHTQDTHPPVTFDAELGQTLSVTVTDYNYCDTNLSALTLHFGTDSQQADMIPGFCLSSCPDHECFDADYVGPWPGIIYEYEAEISIP